MSAFKYISLICEIKAQTELGQVCKLEDFAAADVAPHDWREEHDTIVDWFIKTCRAHEIVAVHDPVKREYTLTRQT